MHATPLGERLAERYLAVLGVHVLTIDYTLAEIAAKLFRLGLSNEAPRALGEIESASNVIPITTEVAGLAAALRWELRRTDSNASLADAVVLAAARLNGAILISGDSCYGGQPDVRAS